MRGSRRLRLATGLGTVGLALALAVGGCSGNSENADPMSGGVAEQPKAAAPGAAEGQPQGAADKDVPADLRINQRSIIYTGSVTVRVDDVDRQAAHAVGITTGAGGFVGGDQRTRDGSHSQATLQLRIPASRFTTVVGQLAGLGDEERREISTQDVTEEALDLDARISTQRARVDSGRRLLAQAKSLSELISLEGEVAKREADLASMEAKKRHIDDLTTLSTITLVLIDRDSTAAADEPRTGFLAGLSAGWRALVASLQVLLTLLGALLPWLVLLGGPVLAVLWWYRRGRRRAAPPTPAAPVAPSGSADR